MSTDVYLGHIFHVSGSPKVTEAVGALVAPRSQ